MASACKPPLPMRPDGLSGKLFAWIMERMNAPAYDAVLDALFPAPGEALLEIGFGTGAFLDRAAARMGYGRLAGVDPAPLMVATARRRLRPAECSFRVDLREAGADGLDWPVASFDAVAAIHSFQFWADPGASLQTLRKLLRPGGRLVLCLRRHGTHPPGWLPNPLSREPDEAARAIELLTECGFVAPRRHAPESRTLILLAETG